jgi:hypothetical protein
MKVLFVSMRSNFRTVSLCTLLVGSALLGCSSQSRSIPPYQPADSFRAPGGTQVSNATLTFASTTPGPTKISIPANQPYTDSGIAVTGNEQLYITAGGKVSWDSGAMKASPNGIPVTK